MVDGEVTGWCVSGISVINLLVQPVWDYVLLVNMQLTSSTWWKGVEAFSIYKELKGMAQDTNDSPEELKSLTLFYD